MADRLKLKVKWWISEKPELKLTPENLKPLLSSKVKFVACTHVSNILGTIHDVKAIADTVHEAGALFCVDGVSFAPHRQVDVKAFGVDFYAFSWYKVYNLLISIVETVSDNTCIGIRTSHCRTVRERGCPGTHQALRSLLQPDKDPGRQTFSSWVELRVLAIASRRRILS